MEEGITSINFREKRKCVSGYGFFKFVLNTDRGVAYFSSLLRRKREKERQKEEYTSLLYTLYIELAIKLFEDMAYVPSIEKKI